MSDYRFLIDNDSLSSARYFPKRRIVTFHQAGLEPSAPDVAIVVKAYEFGCIIVSANGPHFEAEMRKFLATTKRKDCHDLYGLVIIPNQAAIQDRVLPKLATKLRLEGKRISWDDVWRKNLLVRVRSDGVVNVRDELGRCFYCKKLELS
ncbi:MAG: hypothetical protein ABSG60_09720 [Terracidiphilus sp.]|jgi:hypothetical protein